MYSIETMVSTNTFHEPFARVTQAIASLAHEVPQVDFVECRVWHSKTSVPEHAHANLYQFDYFTGGKGSYTVDGVGHEVRPSTLYMVPPGKLHSIESSQDKPLDNLSVKFRLESTDLSFLPASLELEEKLSGRVTTLFRQLVSEVILNERESQVIGCLRLSELLILVLRHFRETQLPHDIHPLVAAATLYIHEHFDEQMSLDGLGRAVGSAGEHLCRVFKKETGTTPFTFLRRYRVEKAKGELERTQETVGSIAGRCGFRTSKDMNRVFQAIIGMSPSEYRRSLD